MSLIGQRVRTVALLPLRKFLPFRRGHSGSLAHGCAEGLQDIFCSTFSRAGSRVERHGNRDLLVVGHAVSIGILRPHGVDGVRLVHIDAFGNLRDIVFGSILCQNIQLRIIQGPAFKEQGFIMLGSSGGTRIMQRIIRIGRDFDRSGSTGSAVGVVGQGIGDGGGRLFRGIAFAVCHAARIACINRRGIAYLPVRDIIAGKALGDI